MRFYQRQHPFYCGVDLHARKIYVTIVDQSGWSLKNCLARSRRPKPVDEKTP
jgi:Ethanolamine utilization protein EutJ (predicted chaperonin)